MDNIEQANTQIDAQQLKNAAATWKQFLMVCVIVTVVCIFLALGAIISQAIRSYLNENTITDNANTALTAKWHVIKATVDAQGNYTLNLKSTIGSIREITKVRSYSISSNGQKVAISTGSGIQVINLINETTQDLTVPFPYNGDGGKAITWSHDDELLAVIVAKDQQIQNGTLLIYSKDGKIVKEISGKFTYNMNSRNYYPAKFSFVGNYLIARTYKEATEPELGAAYLTVFDMQGNEVRQIKLRDAVSTPDQIVYSWAPKTVNIQYRITTVDEEVNMGDRSLFNEVSVTE